ncbi:hypothetical protein D9613_011160 [Agrocybe pediades]|uniref:Uncharacterized protein n=1 Tax=Agrocybe pediades TaxID=84607 RepID=A0A8H4VKF5_9AGAR|nr:hypothetical protein D9613_011160 [Agrocybe pediades]
MPLVDLDALPPTIELGKGCTMTFLRNEPYLCRIHVTAIPASEGETLYVFPHWHDEHDELFRVVKGRLEVLIGTVTKQYVPEDGEIRIPKGVVHSMRTFHDEETIFEERTEPMDEQKELFFRNLLVDGQMPKDPLQAMIAMHNGDTRPAVPGHILWLERAITTVFGGYVAPFFGYKIKYHGLKEPNATTS